MKRKENRTRPANRWRAALQRSFLAISVIFSVLLMTQCRKIGDFWPPKHFPHHHKPPSSEPSTSLFTALFVATANSAGGEIAGAAAGWAVSALGLSAASEDYTIQLNKIDQDLQVISTQLTGIQNELQTISNQLGQINCGGWQQTLVNYGGRVDNLFGTYSGYVASASVGDPVMSSDISDWVDQVLAQGAASGQTSMGDILASLALAAYQPPSSGLIPACVQTITAPADGSFGTDTAYYKQVNLYTQFWANYQVRALTMLNEAIHYRAWQAAGSPTSDSLSSDSTSYICNINSVKSTCNQAAKYVNLTYNNLIIQLTSGGAPYTNDSLVMSYAAANPYLWPYSLEGFTSAAGNTNNCAYPLTAAAPCGITAGWYDKYTMGDVTYNGYTGWQKAGNTLLTYLLAGWKSGTAGHYLESRGFKYMENKIILSSNTINIVLHGTQSTESQNVVCFFDTDIDYNTLPGFVCSGAQFNQLAPYNKKNGGICDISHTYTGFSFYTPSFVPPNRKSFYNLSGWARNCGSQDITPFTFSEVPGWAISGNKCCAPPNFTVYDNAAKAEEFRWPVAPVAGFSCTDNRSPKNAGGVWTMCGDDFTAWLSSSLPRPETCDNPGTGVTCTQL